MSYPSESFEKFIVPGLFAPWAEKLIKRADPHSGERVLDVACGTGIVARRIALMVGQDGTVAGIDFNPKMIREARAAALREGLSIDFREGKAEALPFPGESFDLVTCQFGLMFFSDPAMALREMRRVLAPGGRATLSVWQGIGKHPFYQKLQEVSTKCLGISGVDQVYSMADSKKLHDLIVGAGFRHVKIEAVSITGRFSNPQEFLIWETGVEQADVPAMGHLSTVEWDGVLAGIRRELQAHLQGLMSNGEVAMDYHAHLVLAKRE